jgi:2-amino-4,5-dihydroxy-6-oxo-7-(phosphooxy)heptanoate synthase
MSPTTTFARRVRLNRLHRYGDDRLLVVPLDHSVTDGPVTGGRGLDRLVGQLADNGADAVVLHKGAVRHVDPVWFDRLALIVHLSASTAHAPDVDAKYLVASVEEALRLGADAVSVHVNLGSRAEATQVADLARVADACDRWNLPLLAMMYVRGPRVADPHRPDLVAHAAVLAADLGADLVKTVHVGRSEDLAAITRDLPVPLVVAGGPVRDAADLLASVADALRGGAAGVAVGRNVFAAPDPGAVTRALAALIHGEPGGDPGFDVRELRAPVAAR